jgi:hypothetical protein
MCWYHTHTRLGGGVELWCEAKARYGGEGEGWEVKMRDTAVGLTHRTVTHLAICQTQSPCQGGRGRSRMGPRSCTGVACVRHPT